VYFTLRPFFTPAKQHSVHIGVHVALQSRSGYCGEEKYGNVADSRTPSSPLSAVNALLHRLHESCRDKGREQSKEK
jgi:hypothetical protein